MKRLVMRISHVRFNDFSILALLCFASLSNFAQDPKVAKLAFDDGNYFKAIEMYEKFLMREPNEMEANYLTGLSYLRTHIAPQKALEYLLKAEKQDKFPEEGYLHIAEAYTYHLKYDEALLYLNKFQESGNVSRKNQSDFDRRMANYSAALELLKYPVNVTFKNMGPDLNSEFGDYHPFIDKKEQLLVFTSRRKTKPGAQPEFDGYYPSNLFMSEKKNGEWSKAIKLSDRINTNYDEQSVGLTDSGDSLLFYVDHVDNFGNIYVGLRKNNVFTDPKPLDGTVNSAYVESSCSISRDGSVLIFSSDRPGGSGALDIWMRRKLPNGQWGDPLNLGPEINTEFDEDFPTLSGDGRTLYFCSNGHPGMGNFDLFFSTWDFETNAWSKPQNLGYPINTPSDEKSISFNESGDRAYMTSFREDGLGDLDIYEVSYNDLRNSLPAVFLVTLPQETHKTLSDARITVKNEYDELVGEYAPNSITKQYLMALYPGKYFMYLDVPGYAPYNEMIVVNNAHVRQEKNYKSLKLQK